MKRFAIFVHRHRPDGGMTDFIAAFDSYNEAEKYISAHAPGDGSNDSTFWYVEDMNDYLKEDN